MILRKTFVTALILLAPTACKTEKSSSTGYKKNTKLPAASGDSLPTGDVELEEPPTTFISSWSQCFALNGCPIAKGGSSTIFLLEDGELKYLEKTFPDAECKTSFTDAQLSTLYKSSNPSSKPTKAETTAFNKAMRTGFVSTGAYKAPATEGAEGTMDLSDSSGATKYLSYKITGTTLSTSMSCAEEDVGKITGCKAVTGDSEETRSKDFSSPTVYTKVGATAGAVIPPPVVPGAGTTTALVGSTYTLCMPSNDANAKGFLQEFSFTDATNVTLLNKIKGDATCTADLTAAQMLAFYKQSNPDQASATVVPEFFSGPMTKGTIQKAIYVATSATAGTMDIPDEETKTTAYISYKIEAGKLHLTIDCEKEDIGVIPSCKAITGNTAANRATDFSLSMILNRK